MGFGRLVAQIVLVGLGEEAHVVTILIKIVPRRRVVLTPGRARHVRFDELGRLFEKVSYGSVALVVVERSSCIIDQAGNARVGFKVELGRALLPVLQSRHEAAVEFQPALEELHVHPCRVDEAGDVVGLGKFHAASVLVVDEDVECLGGLFDVGRRVGMLVRFGDLVQHRKDAGRIACLGGGLRRQLVDRLRQSHQLEGVDDGLVGLGSGGIHSFTPW